MLPCSRQAMSAKPRIVTQLLIDGKFQDSASGKVWRRARVVVAGTTVLDPPSHAHSKPQTFDTISPATEEKIASVWCTLAGST